MNQTALIEKLSHDGRGIARVNGKVTFIQNALPLEEVSFKLYRRKSDFDEGVMLEVITPSPERVEPRCPHFLVCGGCSMQHLQASIHHKQTLLLDMLSKIGHVQPEEILPPLESKLWHYRNKARLSVKFVSKKQSVLIGFREKNNPRYIADVHQCPVLPAKLDALLTDLRQLLNQFEVKDSIAQIELAAGDDEIALIFRNVTPLTAKDQDNLRAFARATHFRIFLQPGGMDSVTLFYPEDGKIFLEYHLPEDQVTLKFHPTDFTQVNAEMNRQMVREAMNLMALQPTDEVIDLFCGLGNFSLPMARVALHVLGVEGSEAMVNRAQMNARSNGIQNATFLCANLEEDEIVNSLKNHSKMLLDPPRTGARNIVEKIDKLNLQRIVYVSCNPATLARDAGILVHQKGFQLMNVRVMDMFPHTSHVESMALFQR